MCNGCYDLLSTHHLNTLKFASENADIVLVAVNSDESVKRLKGESRPIIPLAERMNMLASLEYVDFVIPFGEDTPLKLIQKLNPKYVIKGGDYKGKEVVSGESQLLIAPLLPGHSTTNTIKKIKNENTNKKTS